MRHLLLSIIALLLVACAPTMHEPKHPAFSGTVIVFHGDTSFSATEKGVIDQAAERWAYFSNGIVLPRVIWDDDFNSITSIRAHAQENVILRITGDNALTRAADLIVGGRALAFTMQNRQHKANPESIYFIADRLDGRWEEVALHEFGHAVGWLKDRQEPGMVMSGHISGALCPSKSEMTEFCEEFHCDVENTRYCK